MSLFSRFCRWFRFTAALLLGSGLAGCSSLPTVAELERGLISGRFISIAGQQVHIDEQGQGDPVFLVHGFGGSTFSWREVLPELAKQHRVIALDLNGFGFTERPRKLTRYARSGQIRLILSVMDALGEDSAHFIGHSYGGGVITAMAALHPKRVRSLVLVDSTAPNWALARQNNLAELSPLTWLFVRSYALRPANVRKALERSWFDDSQVTDQVVDAYYTRLRIAGAARAYRGLSTATKSPDEEKLIVLQDIQQPVLMVWGADDTLIPVAAAQVAADALPNGRLEILENCGHSPMEERPQAFLDSVRPFLASLPTRKTL
ncbi:MAG: alpha/beta hydrolase [Deltaproteobacteria bacterium]|nr:alpha/beta hydrolase [Deltaproteobacteria bacterium]